MFSDFLVFQNQNNFFYFLGNAGDSVMKAANSLFGKKERKHASNEELKREKSLLIFIQLFSS